MTTGTDTPRFALLDRLRGWRGERELDLGSRQQQTLLALLLARQGARVPVATLVAAVWGEDPPARAVGTLRTYVSRLRKLLEPPDATAEGAPRTPRLLVSERGGYALRVPAEAVDLGRFQRDVASADRARAAGRPAEARDLLRAALDLWGDEPLAGLAGPGIEEERSRLVARRLDALEARLELEVELGGHAAVLGELRELAERHPLRERLAALLMRALVLNGREGQALAVFDRTRRMLAAEFGLDPGRHMSALAEGITRAGYPAGPGPAAGFGPAGGARCGTPAEAWAAVDGAGCPGTATGAADTPSGGDGPPPGADGTAPPPTRLPRPAQLPRDIADFTGRSEEVRSVVDGLTAGSGYAAPVVVVSGTTGVGKSTLAVHAAHRVCDAFPDGQLYADLRGPDEVPKDPVAVLSSFLRSLASPGRRLPEDLADLVALYRSELAARRVLVLLDNVADTAALGPLLPGGQGCAALVTAGTRLTALAGAHHVHLGVLPRAEALGWLETALGAERVAAEPLACAQLVDRCAGLPLALRVAIARLATRPSWAVAAVTAELTDRHGLSRLALAELSVEGALRRDYTRLPERLRSVFARVALAREPDGRFGPLAVAPVLGVGSHQARELCEQLVDLSWLESPTPGRYHVHALLREFAVTVRWEDAPPPARADLPATPLFPPDPPVRHNAGDGIAS
ncbi:BTAD domain-containing putative transcriptional regulator [Streptomyces sp. NPDC046887]|uniref:AfsR/SARP family transcriptional regulator n=1 Tax=Streptomyces sp. NPDC046887 TaxID=3155472 RepID=UPI0033F7924C